ncbi:hypothetical protein BGZ54_001888 [Gamsiella multidivaricata]|nr:hypothetical protein BGZ54_001888 [Gamsiella multidivaricata]
MSKLVHPFKDVTDIPNIFYFLNTSPYRYDAGDYFRTFSDLHTSKKIILHDRWNRAINILLSSNAPKFQNAGSRLLSIWKTPGKGLAGFWAQQEQLESAQDDLQRTTTMVRKRSYRSVRHHIFQAFSAVGNPDLTKNDEPAGEEEERRVEDEDKEDEEEDEEEE